MAKISVPENEYKNLVKIKNEFNIFIDWIIKNQELINDSQIKHILDGKLKIREAEDAQKEIEKVKSREHALLRNAALAKLTSEEKLAYGLK